MSYEAGFLTLTERDELWDALDAAAEYRRARTSLRWALNDLLIEYEPWPTRTCYGGFGWWRSGFARHHAPSFPQAPFGWRWLKEEDRNAAVCLPLWLYWPVRLWRDWPWTLLHALERHGLAEIRWTRAIGPATWRFTLPRAVHRFLWCFLNDRDHYDPPLDFGGR